MPDRLGVMIPLAPVHYKSCGRLDKHMLPSTPFLLWLRRGDVEHDPGPSLRCTQSYRDGLNGTRRCRSALFLDIAMVQHRQTKCGCVWVKLLTSSWQKGHLEENTKKGLFLPPSLLDLFFRVMWCKLIADMGTRVCVCACART